MAWPTSNAATNLSTSTWPVSMSTATSAACVPKVKSGKIWPCTFWTSSTSRAGALNCARFHSGMPAEAHALSTS